MEIMTVLQPDGALYLAQEFEQGLTLTNILFTRDAFQSQKEFQMNKNQVEGAVKDAAGKVQQKTGELVGSDKQQVKGLVKQAEGKTQKAVGDIENAVKKK